VLYDREPAPQADGAGQQQPSVGAAAAHSVPCPSSRLLPTAHHSKLMPQPPNGTDAHNALRFLQK
jgi:hypothetical protein